MDAETARRTVEHYGASGRVVAAIAALAGEYQRARWLDLAGADENGKPARPLSGAEVAQLQTEPVDVERLHRLLAAKLNGHAKVANASDVAVAKMALAQIKNGLKRLCKALKTTPPESAGALLAWAEARLSDCSSEQLPGESEGAAPENHGGQATTAAPEPAPEPKPEPAREPRPAAKTKTKAKTKAEPAPEPDIEAAPKPAVEQAPPKAFVAFGPRGMSIKVPQPRTTSAARAKAKAITNKS